MASGCIIFFFIMHSREDFIETLIHKYERYVAPFTFIIGFVFDTLTLRRIDIWFDHYILIGYLLLAAIGIIMVNAYEAGHLHVRPWDSVVPFMPVMVQFGFGGLFSAFVIFYTISGVVSKSWFFLLVLCVLLIGNERFRKRYQHLTFQLSIFFIVLFSYMIFALPLISKQIGTLMFLLSGVASLVLLGLFILFLSQIVPLVRRSYRSIGVSVGIIYVAFHLLYFANIIPPIPLSLKESGIYHTVAREASGSYRLTFESPPWYAFLRETNSTYHWREGESIYFFSSVFAPTELNTIIFHHWFYYDDIKKKWVDRGNISIPIIGGRGGGYRGYSFVSSGKPGKWRVEVTTMQGQTLGRETFTVIKADNERTFRTKLK